VAHHDAVCFLDLLRLQRLQPYRHRSRPVDGLRISR
jgi:hypothetical protein